MAEYPKIAQLKTFAAFRNRLAELGLSLPVDDTIYSAAQGSPLAAPLTVAGRTIGNRWVIHPMEGWDAQPDGSPSELTLRRWRNFGRSGAKLIWGGEAAAVQPDGRANPRQTMAIAANLAGLRQLRDECLAGHRDSGLTTDDLQIGLQLTHSGRFARPHSKQLEPRIAYHHPLLDAKFGIDPTDQSLVWTDDDLERLIDNYVAAAKLAAEAGFDFVDVKACHGYLLHEFLSARIRPGRFGGDFAGRTRLLMTIIERIRAEVPQLWIGVRLSVFDQPPYETSRDVGRPMPLSGLLPYHYGFGVAVDDPLQQDLTEPLELLRQLQTAGVPMVNLSCGSPYYNPHIQRPAIFPPSDGYLPPEDPLVGVVRQLQMVRQCQTALPDLPMIASGLTYLQDYLCQVAQAVVRDGWTQLVGLGRMVLSYPTLPLDTLNGSAGDRKKICRTFSDCTTAPRHGIVSGCYPLDPFYKQLPAAAEVQRIKSELKQG